MSQTSARDTSAFLRLLIVASAFLLSVAIFFTIHKKPLIASLNGEIFQALSLHLSLIWAGEADAFFTPWSLFGSAASPFASTTQLAYFLALALLLALERESRGPERQSRFYLALPPFLAAIALTLLEPSALPCLLAFQLFAFGLALSARFRSHLPFLFLCLIFLGLRAHAVVGAFSIVLLGFCLTLSSDSKFSAGKGLLAPAVAALLMLVPLLLLGGSSPQPALPPLPGDAVFDLSDVPTHVQTLWGASGPTWYSRSSLQPFALGLGAFILIVTLFGSKQEGRMRWLVLLFTTLACADAFLPGSLFQFSPFKALEEILPGIFFYPTSFLFLICASFSATRSLFHVVVLTVVSLTLLALSQPAELASPRVGMPTNSWRVGSPVAKGLDRFREAKAQKKITLVKDPELGFSDNTLEIRTKRGRQLFAIGLELDSSLTKGEIRVTDCESPVVEEFLVDPLSSQTRALSSGERYFVRRVFIPLTEHELNCVRVQAEINLLSAIKRSRIQVWALKRKHVG